MDPDSRQYPDAAPAAVLAHAFDIVVALDQHRLVKWRQVHNSAAFVDPSVDDAGEMIFRRIHPDDLPMVLEVEDALRSGRSDRERLTFRIRAKHDETILQTIAGIAAGIDDEGERIVVMYANLVSEEDIEPALPRSLTDAAPVGLGVWTASDHLVWCNEALQRLTGLGPSTFIDADPADLTLASEIARLAGKARAGDSAVSTVYIDGRDIRIRAGEFEGSLEDDVMISAEDVTAEMTALRSWQQSERRFAATFEHSSSGIGVIDLRGRVRKVNQAWAEMTGRPTEALCGRTLAALAESAGPEHGSKFVEEMIALRRPAFRAEMPCLHPTAGPRWLELHLTLVGNGDNPSHYVANMNDLTDRKKSEQLLRDRNDMLRDRTTHDALTRLPNRVLLEEHLVVEGARLRRQPGQTYVLSCELAGFAGVSDEIDAAVSDQALVEIARRLNTVCRDGDIVARVGKDEFAVVISNTSRVGVERVGQRIVAAINGPMLIDNRPISARISVGIAELRSADSIDHTLRRSAAAACQAGRTGAGYCFDEDGPGDRWGSDSPNDYGQLVS